MLVLVLTLLPGRRLGQFEGVLGGALGVRLLGAEGGHDGEAEHGAGHAHHGPRRAPSPPPLALDLDDVVEALLEDVVAVPDGHKRNQHGAA